MTDALAAGYRRWKDSETGEWGEVRGFDLDRVKRQKHNFIQVGNLLKCTMPGHHHTSFTGRQLNSEELDRLNWKEKATSKT